MLWAQSATEDDLRATPLKVHPQKLNTILKLRIHPYTTCRYHLDVSTHTHVSLEYHSFMEHIHISNHFNHMIQHPTVRYNNTVSDNAHQHVVFHVLSTYTLETQGTAYTKTNTHACAHTHIYTHKMNKSGPLTACLKQLLQCLNFSAPSPACVYFKCPSTSFQNSAYNGN